MWRAVHAVRLTQPDRGVPKILYVTPCDTDTEITFFESRPPWSRRVRFPFSARENLPSRILAIIFTFDPCAIVDRSSHSESSYFPSFLSWRIVLKISKKRVVCKLELRKERVHLELVFSNHSSAIIFDTISWIRNPEKFFRSTWKDYSGGNFVQADPVDHVSSIHIQRYTPVAI